MSVNQKPVKVCFISPKAYPLFNPDIKEVFGGAEVDLYYLATELAKDENFRISFITADYSQDKIEKIRNVTVIKSLTFRENPLIGAVKIWRALNQADADIYMIKTISMGMFLVVLFCRLKSRCFIYRTANSGECNGSYIREHPLMGRIYRWSLGKTDMVFAQNDSDKENLKKTTGVNAVVVPNGHRLNDWPEQKRDSILWVGRSAKVKRPALFINLAEEFPNEKFVMICQRATGDQNYEQLVSKAKGVDNLQFIKRVPFSDIDDYFQRAKLFVNTSEAEGFPNTFIQSCKAATPILSLNVNPDGFLDEYNCGICCKDDLQLLMEKLKYMLEENHFKEVGENARKYVEQYHNVEKIAEEYKKFFRNLSKLEY